MSKKKTKLLGIQYADCCVEVKQTDKSTYRISIKCLDELCSKAFSSKKEPILIIGIRRSEGENYLLHCHISLEKRAGVSRLRSSNK